MRPTAESITAGLDFSGRRAIVTGASAGLGRECARVLALRGAEVVLGCRDEAKAAAVTRAIAERHGDDVAARCRFGRFDGDCMQSAGDLAAAQASASVDWVFLNAGIFSQPFRLTPDGHEATMAANYLAHFRLLHELVARRALAPRARVVASLSEAVVANPFARADVEAVTSPDARRHSKQLSSPHSKILLALALVELARRTPGTRLEEIVAVGALPPATLTNNVSVGGAVQRWAAKAFGGLVLGPVEEGAVALVWPTFAELAPPGPHFATHAMKTRSIAKKATDPDAAARAWLAAERALGLPALDLH